MAKIADYTIKGKSGTAYKFAMYPFDTTWNEIGAVYIVTARREKDGKGLHTHIYVGETGNIKERHNGDDHHKADCFAEHDANCIGVYPEENAQKRLTIEADILAAGVWPCND